MTDTTLTQPEADHSLINIEHHHLKLNNIKYTAHKPQDIENDIDPENNFFLNINSDCHYYSDDQYNSTFKNVNKISIIHFNIRRLYSNFDNIKDYLKQFNLPFNIILISETWINEERDMDFGLEGYELICMNRRNKSGGGVAMYVDLNYKYKVLENMSTVVDNVFECISTEINRANKKNIIISCIYRTPGSNIDILQNWMEEHLSNINHKIMFIGGDFNIDLLNPNKHKITDNFINTLYSIGLHPKITRPS